MEKANMAETTQSHRVEGKGVTLEVYADGSGPALVVLPSYGRGGGEDFDVFASIVSAVGFKVLRPQPRGVSGSKGRMDGLSLHDQADDVALVIRELGDGKAVVLGHAFGHGVAKTVAADYSPLVSGVIVAAAQCSSVPPDIERTPHQACDLNASTEERLAALRKGFFAPSHDASIWLNGWYPETMRMQVSSVGRTSANDFRDAGSAPLLEIIPDSDPFKPREYWGELRQQFGDRVSTEIVADASHSLFPEQPHRVAEIVIEWCQRLVFHSAA
jgi:pimeloyl-ACP methyl ester carboxylesterase